MQYNKEGTVIDRNERFARLFERSEFLIDTSQKKSLRVCTCARVHVSNNLGFSVRMLVFFF